MSQNPLGKWRCELERRRISPELERDFASHGPLLYEALLDEFLHGDLRGRQLENAMHLLFRLRGFGRQDDLLVGISRLFRAESENLRQRAAIIAATMMRLDSRLRQPVLSGDAVTMAREYLDSAIRDGLIGDASILDAIGR